MNVTHEWHDDHDVMRGDLTLAWRGYRYCQIVSTPHSLVFAIEIRRHDEEFSRIRMFMAFGGRTYGRISDKMYSVGWITRLARQFARDMFERYGEGTNT